MATDADGATRPVLYHLHIPKTAGTTLYAALESRFEADRVCPVCAANWELLRMPPERFASFDLVGGHLPFGYCLPQIMGRPVQVVTMLREPRALLLSLYKQVMQEPRDPIRPYVDANCPTVEAFFFDPMISEWVADSQTRFLSVTDRRYTVETAAKVRAARTDEVAGIVRAARDREQMPSPYEMLTRARSRLSGCVEVGLVERFDESLDRIAQSMGWPPFAPVTRRNVSQIEVADGGLSARLAKRLDDLSFLDRILYDEAKARFDAAAKPSPLAA